MSEALITPEAPADGAAPAVVEAAPAAAAPAEGQETLITPEPVEGEAAAAPSQGAGEGEAADGGKPKGEAADGKKEGEAEQPAADAAPGAPEAYAPFSMPEGFQISDDVSGDLTTLAKELNLPQDKAQKLIDLGVKHAQGLQKVMQDTLTTAKAQWADQVRADKEIGGAQLSVNMATAKKALLAFGSPALTGVLNQTGLSQHPEFLRLLVRVGEAISEDDTLVAGDGGSGGKPAHRDHAKRLYPGMK